MCEPVRPARPLQNHFLHRLQRATDAGAWMPQYLHAQSGSSAAGALAPSSPSSKASCENSAVALVRSSVCDGGSCVAPVCDCDGTLNSA